MRFSFNILVLVELFVLRLLTFLRRYRFTTPQSLILYKWLIIRKHNLESLTGPNIKQGDVFGITLFLSKDIIDLNFKR